MTNHIYYILFSEKETHRFYLIFWVTPALFGVVLAKGIPRAGSVLNRLIPGLSVPLYIFLSGPFCTVSPANPPQNQVKHNACANGRQKANNKFHSFLSYRATG